MADSLKVLGQIDPSATTVTTLYTVPDMTQTTVSSIVASLTPTPKDDVWIGKLYKLIDLLALNIGKAKNKPGG